MKRRLSSIIERAVALTICFLALPFALLAEGPPKKSTLDNPMAVVLLVVIVALLIVIILMANVLIGTAQFYAKREKESRTALQNIAGKTTLVLLFCLGSIGSFAQEAAAAATAAAPKSRSVSGLSESTFIMLMSVIFLELIVILAIGFFLKRLLSREATPAVATEEALVTATPKERGLKKWWARANSFRSIKEEAEIDLGHDYDSIRELDNRLPPWWLYGFYCTIIFAVVYLWRFEISHSAPSSLQEYTASVAQAEEEKEVSLSKAASKVDENTVQMLDAAAIASGKTIFAGSCAPCHGADGGGVVGPNLTDDYWLHGGSLKDVFKTIKYGVQEKGMKAWKDDFSPVQIAQLASFIKSIHGTKVATPKEPQGEIFKETAAAAADSTQKSGQTNH
ncbi:cbb3-type cytochrome c oxidase N-terminal domain-containing protein [Sediminibacterium soli]|uniref:cbb3-type cytochrome c oxidase N-terminal domain-containing protein n=1 Tax=Sediminibacterium soli TaxID=2698829 RepID=UPI001379F372|nr:cbb3-type cytochrome c oxidase N-terminal domain-containing protein [Sediminibacterium soli]NCI45681.1 c-type cytochrome [Sediminibacterium soli]